MIAGDGRLHIVTKGEKKTGPVAIYRFPGSIAMGHRHLRLERVGAPLSAKANVEYRV